MCRIASVALLTLLVATSEGALADDAPFDRQATEAQVWAAEGAPRLTCSNLPGAPQRSLPGYRTDTAELQYRWWTRGEIAHLGVGLGMVMQMTRASDPLQGGTEPSVMQWSESTTALLLGMRVCTSERSAFYADAAIGRRGAAADAVVGKVGFELKAARSGWDIGYGGLGLRMADDSGMSVRLRRSGLAVKWHKSF